MDCAFAEHVALRMAQPRFVNARSVRSAIEWLRLQQAGRLVAADGVIARGDLMEITAADVRASRVFKISAGAVASRACSAAQDGDL
jgi:AAA lid domain-containing protein